MSYTKVVYDGWMVRYGTRTIGWLFLHMRYFVPESRLLAYYKRKPQDNVVPIKTLVIDGNCRVDDRVVNLTLIDLPGLTIVVVEGHPESIVEDIENMVCSYVKKEMMTEVEEFGFGSLEVHSDLEILIISSVSYILCLQKYSDLEVLEVLCVTITFTRQKELAALIISEGEANLSFPDTFYTFPDTFCLSAKAVFLCGCNKDVEEPKSCITIEVFNIIVNRGKLSIQGEKKMSLVNDVAVLFVMGYDEFTTGKFVCITWYQCRDYEVCKVLKKSVVMYRSFHSVV
ncbi:hypothetical protein Tco_1577065 [Tanacetum coccineum]